MAPKPRPPTRNIMRWDSDHIERILIGLVYECHKANIQLPWEEVRHWVPKNDKGMIPSPDAMKQQIEKRRKRRMNDGERVPPVLGRVVTASAPASCSAPSSKPSSSGSNSRKRKAEDDDDQGQAVSGTSITAKGDADIVKFDGGLLTVRELQDWSPRPRRAAAIDAATKTAQIFQAETCKEGSGTSEKGDLGSTARRSIKSDLSHSDLALSDFNCRLNSLLEHQLRIQAAQQYPPVKQPTATAGIPGASIQNSMFPTGFPSDLAPMHDTWHESIPKSLYLQQGFHDAQHHSHVHNGPQNMGFGSWNDFTSLGNNQAAGLGISEIPGRQLGQPSAPYRDPIQHELAAMANEFDTANGSAPAFTKFLGQHNSDLGFTSAARMANSGLCTGFSNFPTGFNGFGPGEHIDSNVQGQTDKTGASSTISVSPSSSTADLDSFHLPDSTSNADFGMTSFVRTHWQSSVRDSAHLPISLVDPKVLSFDSTNALSQPSSKTGSIEPNTSSTPSSAELGSPDALTNSFWSSALGDLDQEFPESMANDSGMRDPDSTFY